MDRCQPFYIRTESEKRYFLLIIEDENEVKSGNPEPYYYAFNWGVLSRFVPFASPLKAFEHAMNCFPSDEKILDITSMGMGEFLTDSQVKSFVT